MAAVIDLHTGRRLDQQDVVEPPALRLVEGGRSPEAIHWRRVYLRRRILALVAALVVSLAVFQAVSAASSLLAPTAPAASSESYVVSPGDSYWSVARAVAPDIDPRNVVDDLIGLNGDGPLRPGQRLRLPDTTA